MSKPLAPPQALPAQAAAGQLPAMNQAAANAGNPKAGVLPCEKKSWFQLDVILVNDKKEESRLSDLAGDFKFSDLGELQKISADGTIRVEQLEPGGKARLKQLAHDTHVYEALGGIK